MGNVPVIDKTSDLERLRQELDYYKRQLDELAGENVRLDYTLSGLRHELKQKRQGFAALSELQQSISTYRQLSDILKAIMQAINSTLGMDRTVVLTPTDVVNQYSPSQWLGFPSESVEQLPLLSVKFPPLLSNRAGFLVVNKSSEMTPWIQKIQAAFDLPYFVCLPLIVDNILLGLLLTGRLVEARPFYPPLDQGDVDTLQAIASLVSASVQNRRLAVLEETDRLKTEFFANISHEFRTPLTLTLGPLTGMLHGRYGEVPKAIRDQVLIMRRNQERLLGLINQILDLAKLEAGREQLKAAPIGDVNRFVWDRVAQFQSMAGERGIELRGTLDPRAEGADLYVDQDMFDKLLCNLLSNALKFTEQGYIDVTTRIEERIFYLTVTDTGIGIQADQIPYIFDRFWQADGSASRQYEGTGLGLAWVKEVAELHGGQVTVQSQYGKGSSFQVTIPLGIAHLDPVSVVHSAEEELPPSAGLQRMAAIYGILGGSASVDSLNQEVEANLDPSKPVILYAEDNPDMRSYIRGLLAGDYSVFLAVDGRDGIEKARQYKPELILADHLMPYMSGRDLLNQVRSDPELRSIPLILLTALGGTEARIEGFAAGADDYLTKPFDEQELLARIRNLLRARAQERVLASINRRMESELQVAREVQSSLLPHEVPRIPGWDFAARWQPVREVAGDYYDFILTGEGQLGLVIADVCDKGAPAALFMALTRSVVRASLGRTSSFADDIACANRQICADSTSGMFVTLVYAQLDPEAGRITYVNAGHIPPLLCKPNARGGQGSSIELTRTGMALGVIADAPYEQRTVQLNLGDFILFYTDGVTDATDLREQQFGLERLQQAILDHRHLPATDIITGLERAMDDFRGTAIQFDDVAIVVVKRLT
jgi:serine phosphatase RsbU (regulator of sigma subunit)/signal transduction histidine kinase